MEETVCCSVVIFTCKGGAPDQLLENKIFSKSCSCGFYLFIVDIPKVPCHAQNRKDYLKTVISGLTCFDTGFVNPI